MREKKGFHESLMKKIENERVRRLKEEKECVTVNKKHKETKAALTKLFLKQYNKEEEQN